MTRYRKRRVDFFANCDAVLDAVIQADSRIVVVGSKRNGNGNVSEFAPVRVDP